MRTFIAIELPSSIHAHVATVQRELQTSLRQAAVTDCFNWVGPTKTHLTLRFLGETSAQQVAQIQQGLARLSQQQTAFGLSVQGVRAFPNLRRPNVLWLGFGGALAALSRFQQQIETLVQRVGFSPELRAFSPHLTLARAQRQTAPARLQAAGRALQQGSANITPTLPPTAGPEFTVTQIVYLHSELRPEGARYTTLGHFSLLGRTKE